MGLFDKKYCDFCGNKIGLLGNKKLEDGNMCKECAAKLSPWFSDRRHTTKADIAQQLAYREQNRSAVSAFTTTRTLGGHMKLHLDENHQKFMVTSASDLKKANPDVLDYAQATGCTLEVKESRNELKTKDKDGKSISYKPPRYEYSYNFYVTIHVNHPYFDEISYSISNGYIKVGERPMTGVNSNWRVSRSTVGAYNENKYYEYMNLGNEIKETIDNMRRIARGETVMPGGQPGMGGAGYGAGYGAGAPNGGAGYGAGAPNGGGVPFGNNAAAAAAASMAAAQAAKSQVICPYCGAPTTPDANGCCEYCGSKL